MIRDEVKEEVGTNELRDFLIKAYGSINTLADLIFPHHKTDGNGNYLKSQPFHDEVDALLRGAVSGKNKYNVLMVLPRGVGKSTTADLFFPVWCLLFTNKRFIVMIGESRDSIREHFHTLTDELKNNPMLKLLNIKVDVQGPIQDLAINVVVPILDPTHSLNGETEKIVRLRAYGVDTVPRGLKIGNNRPDLLIIDDLERQKSGNKTGVESAEYRAEVKKSFYSKIVRLGFNESSLQIVMLGTIMHNDQLLVELLENAKDPKSRPQFKAIRYSMIVNYGTPNAYSIWPEKLSMDDFNGLLETAKKNGTEGSIYNELLSLPYAPNDTAINENDFRYFKQSGGVILRTDRHGVVDQTFKPLEISKCNIVVAVDLAFTTKTSSDYTAAAVGLVDDEENLYILDIPYGRWTNDEIITQLSAILSKYRPNAVGVEKNRGGEAVIWILERALKNNPHFREITRLSDKGLAKEDRILNKLLLPYKSGRVYHCYGAAYLSEYEDEVRAITKHGIKSKHDDLVDAASYLTELATNFTVFREEKPDYSELMGNKFTSPYVF